jgi:hypothetical protein
MHVFGAILDNWTVFRGFLHAIKRFIDARYMPFARICGHDRCIYGPFGARTEARRRGSRLGIYCFPTFPRSLRGLWKACGLRFLLSQVSETRPGAPGFRALTVSSHQLGNSANSEANYDWSMLPLRFLDLNSHQIPVSHQLPIAKAQLGRVHTSHSHTQHLTI